MAQKSFQEMIDTLRAGQAAGMDCTIALTPEDAGYLADILEEHGKRLRDDVDAKMIRAAMGNR